jgi:hypothetical protein
MGGTGDHPLSEINQPHKDNFLMGRNSVFKRGWAPLWM